MQYKCFIRLLVRFTNGVYNGKKIFKNIIISKTHHSFQNSKIHVLNYINVADSSGGSW